MGRRGGGMKGRNFEMTEQQQRFAEAFISNGRLGKQAALEAGYLNAKVSACNLLRMPAVLNYVSRRVNEQSIVLGLTFDYKIAKLKTVMDLAIPDNVEDMTAEELAKSMTVKISDGLSAISESNKMQGHYSPEKHVNANLNVNTDVDLKELKKITDELFVKHQKEY